MKKSKLFLVTILFSSLSVIAYEGGAPDLIDHKREIEREQTRHPDHIDESISSKRVEDFKEEQELKKFGPAAYGKF